MKQNCAKNVILRINGYKSKVKNPQNRGSCKCDKEKRTRVLDERQHSDRIKAFGGKRGKMRSEGLNRRT